MSAAPPVVCRSTPAPISPANRTVSSRRRSKRQLEASVTVDAGACRITDSHVGVSGPIGDLISQVGGLQELARGFAQAKISEICGK